MIVAPLSKPLCGTVRVPGDKSITHRVLFLSSMAAGTSYVSGLLNSRDTRSSIEVLSSLGASINLEVQKDLSLSGAITGWGSKGPSSVDSSLYCGNSGTTARLLMGLLAPWEVKATITGDESLSSRPMKRVSMPLEEMNASFVYEKSSYLPVSVVGNPQLSPITYTLPVASAQVKSAILFAGMRALGTTHIVEPLLSRDHTENLLPLYGVDINRTDNGISIEGPVVPTATTIDVPGDPSSAAALVTTALLVPQSKIDVEHVTVNPLRSGFIEILLQMGANISVRSKTHDSGEDVGVISAQYSPNLRGVDIPADKISSLIDEIPLLALVASRAYGRTVFHNVGELRFKESNRLEAIVTALSKRGVDVQVIGDDLHIEGNTTRISKQGLYFDTQGDHRLAMMGAIMGLSGTEAVELSDFECIEVSYPEFLNTIERLSNDNCH